MIGCGGIPHAGVVGRIISQTRSRPHIVRGLRRFGRVSQLAHSCRWSLTRPCPEMHSGLVEIIHQPTT